MFVGIDVGTGEGSAVGTGVGVADGADVTQEYPNSPGMQKALSSHTTAPIGVHPHSSKATMSSTSTY